MNKKKGLLVRMLLTIGLPVALIFAIVAVISLYVANQAITSITINELSARSQAVANVSGGEPGTVIDVSSPVAPVTR